MINIYQPVSGGGGGLTIGTTTITSGTSTQLLFDAAGVVSETDGATWNATNKALTVGGATVTTSNPVMDLSQTWNAGAATFTGLKLNVTDTASATASLLMDLQQGGTTKFSVRKDGGVICDAIDFTGGANLLSWSKIYHASNNIVIKSYAQDVIGFSGQLSRVSIQSGFSYSWSSNSDVTNTSDLSLTRKAAASLRLGLDDAASPVAQTLGVQSVVAGTSNTAGANWTLAGSQGTGTGAGGSIIFQTAPAGSTGSAQNALAAVLTLDSTKQADFAGHMQMTEITAPAAGAANTVRLYAEDNGSGKTRLMALFASGAAQQVAIEP